MRRSSLRGQGVAPVACLHFLVVVLDGERGGALLRLLALLLLQLVVDLLLDLDALLAVEPLLRLRAEVFHVTLVLQLLVELLFVLALLLLV